MGELPCGSQPPAPTCVVWSWRSKECLANDGKFQRLKANLSRIAQTFSLPSWFDTFYYANLANLLHPGSCQGVRWARDQPMPEPFPALPLSQGRDPGNEVGETIIRSNVIIFFLFCHPLKEILFYGDLLQSGASLFVLAKNSYFISKLKYPSLHKRHSGGSRGGPGPTYLNQDHPPPLPPSP